MELDYLFRRKRKIESLLLMPLCQVEQLDGVGDVGSFNDDRKDGARWVGGGVRRQTAET